MSLPTVSIIIPCRNEALYVEDCINSILNQDYSGKIEVIVVDGMSDDGTREILEKMGAHDNRVRLLDNIAKTTPQAMNIGLKAAKFDFIIRIDAHAIALPDFIAKNLSAVNESEAVMCAGGSVVNVYQNEVGKEIGLAMSSMFGVGNATFRTGGEKQYVDTLAFGIYKKSVFDIIGYFNEELVRNQDDELNYRLTQAGFKILYDPAIQTKYFVRGSLPKLAKQYFQYGYWKVYVNKLHRTVTSIRQLVPFLFVLSFIVGLLMSVIFPPFLWALAVGTIGYCFAAIVAAHLVSINLWQTFKVARVFPILHFSYGWGYFRGIIDFLILRKKPSEKSKTVTRN